MVFSTGILWSAGPLLLAAHSHALSFELTWTKQAILALIAGVCVLIRPKNVNLILAAYLILLGLLGMVQVSF